jgi:endonuclease/exonuclease/phosphatase family metal-dependent hydrolase
MRLLSYNIHKAIGGRDRRYRLERVLQVLDHEKPDIVCLQEVDRNVKRSKFDNQPELIAEHLHSAGRLFQFTHPVAGGGYGNLLVSRWPFLEQHQISLTLRGCKVRGAQWAVIATPFGELRIVNWHLGLRERERHWQVRRLLEHHLFRGRDHLPTVIIGDTNDWRNTLANGPFAIHGFQHVTAPPSRYRSFPAWWPMGSLDKAFFKGPLRVAQSHVSRRQPAVDASDHLPLILDLEMEFPAPHHSVPR